MSTPHFADNPNPPLTQYLLLHFLANVSQWAELQDALAETGLGRPHTRVLFVLYSAPGITVNELLSAMHESHQNLTTPIKKIIAEGYALTEADPMDRRRKLMYLTPKGKRLVMRILKLHDKRLGAVIARIDPRDFDTFLRVHALLVDRNDEPWFEKLTGLAPVQART